MHKNAESVERSLLWKTSLLLLLAYILQFIFSIDFTNVCPRLSTLLFFLLLLLFFDLIINFRYNCLVLFQRALVCQDVVIAKTWSLSALSGACCILFFHKIVIWLSVDPSTISRKITKDFLLRVCFFNSHSDVAHYPMGSYIFPILHYRLRLPGKKKINKKIK